MDERTQEFIKTWLATTPSVGTRLYLWLQANRYKLRYRFSRSPIMATIVLWLGRCALAAAGPISAYVYGNATLAKAGGLAIGIVVIYAIISFVGHYWANPKDPGNEPIGDAITRAGEVLSRLDGQHVPPERRSRSIDSCLGLIEAYARHVIDGGKGEVAVALAQYTNAEQTQLCVTNRNPGNLRPIRATPFDGSHVLGHHAAQAGKGHRIVQDLRKFPEELRRSPTHTSVSYRSFYIIPMLRQAPEGTEVLGFLSIDCPRPYAFYGNRANLIAVECGAIVNHIRELM